MAGDGGTGRGWEKADTREEKKKEDQEEVE